MNTETTLETNSIISKTGSDITIDAFGDQRIIFGTLSNFGTSFRSSTDTNCGRNIQSGGDHRPQIGGHQISPLAWDVLWFNPVSVSTALVCVGNETRANVLAEASRLFVEGKSTTTGNIITRSDLVVKKTSTTGGTLTGTFTGNHTYTIPDGGGTFLMS
eukprot:gene12527-6350_t